MPLTSDLRYSLRSLRKSPGFAAAAIATLAIGIGANTAVFSVVRAVLLRSPGLPDPDRVVFLWERNPKQGYDANPPSAADFDDWKRESRSFGSLALVDASRQFNLALSGRPERAPGAAIDADALRVLRVAPALGRAFTKADETDRERIVLLSDALWTQRFHRDPGVVGTTLAIDGRPTTVVGVMPPGFAFPGDTGAIGGGAPPAPASLWIPLAMSDAARSQRSSHFLRAIGRLRPGVSVAAAQRELSAIQGRLEREHPSDYVGSEVSAIPFEIQSAGAARRALWTLLGAVAFVLLIACANIAHLLLARAASRRREIAIRTALGAGRGRILRQLAVESVSLALAGAAGGVLLAAWGIGALRSWLPAELPHAGDVRVDGAVLAFTLLLSLAAAALFGSAPALEVSRPDLTGQLTQGARGTGESPRGRRLRDALVVGQIATALLLIVGAALLGRSLLRLERVDPGFEPRGVLTAEITLPDAPYGSRADRARFFHSLDERIAALPGVTAAGMTTQLPLSGDNMNFALEVEGRRAAPGEFPSADVRAVSAGYFGALKIPLRSGRLFSTSDGAEAPHVFVVNEALVRRYFPDRDPIGRRLKIGVNGFEGVVIGVVGDVKQVALERAAGEEAYVAYEQAPFWPTARLVVRSAGDPRALAPAVRDAVRALDASQAVAAIRPLEGVTGRSVAQPRFRAALVGSFGVLALVLAAIGLSGVLSYSVSRRSREIGIRMALGARSGQVVRLVLSQGLGLAALGLAAGLAASFALTRLLSGFLFGVSATDTATFVGAGLLLLTVALLASGIPARRAARVDPMQALRSE